MCNLVLGNVNIILVYCLIVSLKELVGKVYQLILVCQQGVVGENCVFNRKAVKSVCYLGKCLDCIDECNRVLTGGNAGGIFGNVEEPSGRFV